jgi:WD40 repeat protein
MKLSAVIVSMLALGVILPLSCGNLLGQSILEQKPSTFAGQEIRKLHLKDPINGVAWSEDGSRLAALAGNKVTIWETKDWTVLNEFKALGFPYAGNSLVVLPDGTLLTGARARIENNIRVDDVALTQWDVATGKPIRDFPDRPGPSSVGTATVHKIDTFTFSEQGSIVVGFTKSDLFVFDLSSARVTRRISLPLVAREPGFTFDPNRSSTVRDMAMSVAISPNGKLVAVGTFSGRLHFFDPQDGSLLRSIWVYPAGEDGVVEYGCSSLAFNADGGLIAVGKTPAFGGRQVGTEQGTKFVYRKPSPVSTTIWRVADGTSVRSLEGIAIDLLGGKDATTVRTLSWSTENILAVGDGVALRLWQVSESTQREILSLEMKGGFFSVAFSRQGLFAAVNVNDILIFR